MQHSSSRAPWKLGLIYMGFGAVILGIILASFTLGRLGMSLNDLGRIDPQQIAATPVAMGYIAPADAWIHHYQVSCAVYPNDRSGRQLMTVVFTRISDIPVVQPVPVDPTPPDPAATTKKKNKTGPPPTPPPTPVPAPAATAAPFIYNPGSRFILKGISFNQAAIGKVVNLHAGDSRTLPPVIVQYYDLGQKAPFGNDVRFDHPVLESLN